MKRPGGIIICLLLLACAFPAMATHIVGGVMNYKYLGNDNFEINLSVYRDCKRGIPPLDPTATIWVWNHDIPDLFSQEFFQIPFDSTLDASILDPCATIQPDECVNWTRYTGVINLPPNNTGYTVYYQRCCRNNSILNITRSPFSGQIEWGSTYAINIPVGVNGLHVDNTSPVFVNYPPVYICQGKPIDYNHAAFDDEGDRLVYRLCTPVTGASVFDPTNAFTLEPPPFDTVEWNPPYDLNNILGGIPLRIDSVSGLMSGTPGTLGQFVVGVCVDEYRGAQKLTRTVRDFQFNVVNCGLQVVSSFFAPDLECNSLTVNFDNQSVGADRYYWDFGDGDTSTLENPSHTYADTGIYIVSLISVKGDTCTSSFSKQISVQYKRINADFIVADTACIAAGDSIYFIDRSTDSLNVTGWSWTFSTGQTSTAANPVIAYNGILDSITATLLVTSVNGCTSTITKTIALYKKQPYVLPDVITKCSIQNTEIPLTMSGNNTFSWSPVTDLDDPTAQSPNTTTQVNTTYHVIITSVLGNGDTCVQQDSVRIQILNTLQINASDTVSVCNDSVRLGIPLSPGQTVIWSTSNTFSPVIGNAANISVIQTEAVKKYYVKVNASGCEAIDSVVVLFNDTVPQIILTDNILQCSNQVNLSAQVDFSESIIWSTSPSLTPVIGTGNTYSTTQVPKTVVYYISATYRTCRTTDSVIVTIQDTLPVITLADSLDTCSPVVNITANVRNFSSVIWSTSPTFSPVIGSGRTIIVILNDPVQTFYIKAFYRDCEKIDSIVVNYQDTVPFVQVNDSAVFCGSQVTLQATVANADSLMWSDNPAFVPVLSTATTFTTTQSQEYQWYYIKAKYSFCETLDSVLVRVISDPPVFSFADSLYVCGDSVRITGQVSNYDVVEWSYDAGFTTVFSNQADIVVFQSDPQRTYYVRASKGTCTASDSVTVFLNDTVPQVTIDRTVINFCTDSVNGAATAINYTEVAWGADRDFTFILSTGFSFSTTQTEAEHTYYFRARFRFCEVIDSITLYNRSIDYANAGSEVCAGDPVTIDLSVQTASQYEIVWTLADTILLTNNISSVTFTPAISQWIKFDIQNLYGCAVTDSLLVTLNPLPFVEASADPDSVYPGQEVQLLATEHNGYQYQWLPAGELSDPDIFNPLSFPQTTTIYIVTVTDSNNCRNSDSVLVNVVQYICDRHMIFIPNAFSPNGDGVNDVFRVRSSILRNSKLVIYDRWGERVFESTDPDQGWDGFYKGVLAQGDTYAYYFEGECLQREKIIIKGNITLLY